MVIQKKLKTKKMPLTPKAQPPYYEIGTAGQPVKGIWEGKWRQASTSAPTVTVYRNTLGANIIWTRADVGIYLGTISGMTWGDNLFIDCSYMLNDINEIPRIIVQKDGPTGIYVQTGVIGSTLRDGLLNNFSWLNIRITNQ